MNAKIENLKKDMELKVSAYVAGYNAHNLKKSEIKSLKQMAKGAVDAYNDALCKDTYRRWNAEGDPVKTAIRMRFVPGCQAVSYKTDDADIMAASYRDAKIKASLPMMQAVLGADVFADPTWFIKVEKLSYLIANRLNAQLGNGAGFAYQVSDAAKAFSFPSGSNPANIDNMAAAMQDVFDSILFIDDGSGSNLIKVKMNEDLDGNRNCPAWTYIHALMTEEGESDGDVVVRNVGKCSDLIAGAMHQIMTCGDFRAVAASTFTMPTLAPEEAE